MTSYSHNDRITSPHLLDPKEIQKKICSGSDIFGMYPEAYSWKDLASSVGDIQRSAVVTNIPEWILQNFHQYRFLLPGGCIRDS